MEKRKDQKHGGRAYNNRAGHIKAIRLAALILIIPFQFGCHLFVERCPPGEGAFVKPIEPADSIALDMVDPDNKFYHRGCNPRSLCMSHLMRNEDRKRFVEVFVHKPGADHLSKEKGWYRYWLAPAGDPACAAFYASKKVQEDWAHPFRKSYMTPPLRLTLTPSALRVKRSTNRKAATSTARFLKSTEKDQDWCSGALI